jgi:hypothetical protein
MCSECTVLLIPILNPLSKSLLLPRHCHGVFIGVYRFVSLDTGTSNKVLRRETCLPARSSAMLQWNRRAGIHELGFRFQVPTRQGHTSQYRRLGSLAQYHGQSYTLGPSCAWVPLMLCVTVSEGEGKNEHMNFPLHSLHIISSSTLYLDIVDVRVL